MNSLQEKVKQDLENKGVLTQIRKLFKEKIYESIKSQQNEDLLNQTVKTELLTRSGQICCALVQDFLESFDLNLTLSIFLPEAHLVNSRENIIQVENALGVNSSKKNPLLFNLTERVLEGESDREDVTSEDRYIDEEIEEVRSQESFNDHVVESVGNSQGHDQSVNSLAMDEFDYTEIVKKIKK